MAPEQGPLRICLGLLWGNPPKSCVLQGIKHFKKSDTRQVRAVRTLKRTPSHCGSSSGLCATGVLLLLALHTPWLLPTACLLGVSLLPIHHSARMQLVAAKSRAAKKKKTASTRFHGAVAALSHQLSVLEQELAGCRARHSSLTARTRMVSQWLDVLDLVHKSQQPQGSCAEDDEQLEQELLAVRALLSQPASQPNSSASEVTDNTGAVAAAGAPCLDPMLQTIGQPEDTVALLRDLASRQLLPGVETQTALQHLEHHKELAQKLGVQLVQLECLADSAQRVKVLDTIKQLLDR